MKHLIFILFISLLPVLSSCDNTTNITRATGAQYEVVVVMERALWENTTGEAVKEEVLTPVRYLPESEAAMRYTYSSPEKFQSFLKYIRNILIINVDKTIYTKVTLLLKIPVTFCRAAKVMQKLNAPREKSRESYIFAVLISRNIL